MLNIFFVKKKGDFLGSSEKKEQSSKFMILLSSVRTRVNPFTVQKLKDGVAVFLTSQTDKNETFRAKREKQL